MKNKIENDYEYKIKEYLAQAASSPAGHEREGAIMIAVDKIEKAVELEIDRDNEPAAQKLLNLYASLFPILPQDLVHGARQFLTDYGMSIPSNQPTSAPTSMPTSAPTSDEQQEEEQAPSLYDQLINGIQSNGATMLTGLAIFALNHANHDGGNCG